MRNVIFLFTLLLTSWNGLANQQTLDELTEFWRHAAQTVADGDFEAYKKTFHPSAVLVSGFNDRSYPIAHAFARWQQGFIDTKKGKVPAGVEFRWTDHKLSETTAYQQGLFNYYTVDANGVKQPFIAHLSVLLVKENGKWLVVMENQQKKASEQEWKNAAK